MRSFFLFALCTLALSTSCSPGQYDNGGVCTVCTACPANKYRTGGCSGTTNTNQCTPCASACWNNYYISGGCVGAVNLQCLPCTTCGAGKYRSSGCINTGSANSVCSNCATCVTGQYQRIDCSPTTNRLCENCMTTAQCSANDVNARIYGICGGPSAVAVTTCMPAGQALCQICPDVAGAALEDGGLGVECHDQGIDAAFWNDATGDVGACCEAIATQRDAFNMTGLTNGGQARNAWLYDNFLTCTGIRTVYPVP